MRFLRTNTAVRLTVGPFLDKTDGVTPETAITVTSDKLTLMVDDANVPTLVLDTAPTASGGANDMVHVTGDDSGFYDLELAAANVNYVGRAMLSLNDAAVHCPVFHEFMILPANIYDSFVLGTDLLDVSTTQFNGSAVTAASGRPEVNATHISGSAVSTSSAQLGVNVVNAGATAWGSGAITAGSIAAAAITSAKIADDAITAAKIANGAIDELTFADNAISDRVVAADAELTAGAIADAVWEELVADHSGTAGSTAASLAAAGTAGDPWITALPGAYGAGSAGKIVGDNINAAITSRLAPTTAGRTLDVTATGGAGVDWANVENQSTTVALSGTTVLSASNVEADTQDIQTRLPAALVSGRIDSSVGAMAANTLTASALAADAVDEILDDPIGDGTLTMRQALRVIVAAVAAKLSGAATTTITVRNVADSANVIVATVDANGNRSATTVTP